MPKDQISIKGAREHNLKNIDLEIPRHKLIVMTGLSGSGKSSLAFDTIYAEGQRRYVESLSAYARQFLQQMEKPDVDHIEGLSPAVSIDQKSATRNPRSTVGTVTEIHDYLRLLYARIGIPHCPNCGKKIEPQSAQQIIETVRKIPPGTKFKVLAPVVRGRKGEYSELLGNLKKQGFARARVDGKEIHLDEADSLKLARYRTHDIEVVVDRLVMKDSIGRRLADSIETALGLGDGVVVIDLGESQQIFSEQFACLDCGRGLEELTPRMFSFNSPYGACERCGGLGTRMEVDPGLVVADPSLSLREGAIQPFARSRVDFYRKIIEAVCEMYGIDMDAPFGELNDDEKDIILNGSDEPVFVRYRSLTGRTRSYNTTFPGVVANLSRRHRETESEYVRKKIEQYMRVRNCPGCDGARLRPESLAVTVGGINIHEYSTKSAGEARRFLAQLELSEKDAMIARRITKEILERLDFLLNVGLDYLTLDRAASTLAGGEAQRIRLATQIGSGLAGVLYILDEPSIGLHQRDNRRLIETLKNLRDIGNTVIVVEHDEATIREADYVVDIGPGAGLHGGEIVAAGTVQDIAAAPDSVTGQYLRGESTIPVPGSRRKSNGQSVWVRRAAEHNLKGIDVEFPLGLFICVTGVSGSGKSTLVSDILWKAVASSLYSAKAIPGQHAGLEGVENLDKAIRIDQSPIGRTPRSNPATYTKVFDEIRKVFAEVPEARMRGYKPGRFSFNIKGGRCEACQGDGEIKIEMHFLPDIYIPCEVCKGGRYNRETLEVTFKGKNISEVLEMTVEEACEFFENVPVISRRLKTLNDVGLGYVELGQPAPTLSGGEAQRVKLSAELSKRATGRTLYILDEPTTGLHFEDIKKLLRVLARLVDSGNTVLVIEHNLDVIKTADYLIDLGPDGGNKGGRLVASGPPEKVAKSKRSHTGSFLREMLTSAEKEPVSSRT